MRIGFAIPQYGSLANPESLATAARHFETLGADSIWTSERLLAPVKLKVPYPASADGQLPASSRRGLRPLEALSFLAAHTERVALGTSVLIVHLYSPVRLAQSIATLDVLSGGRARLGLGNGWMPEEFEAVGVSMAGMGKRADEYIDVMRTVWTDSPASFEGAHVTLAPSYMDLKPVQKPHPPIYLAAFSQTALARVARVANGWNPAGVPIPGMAAMMGMIRKLAGEYGRDPDSIEMVVRANVRFTGEPLGAQRPVFTGSAEEIREDIARTRDIGADELFFEVSLKAGMTLKDMLARADELYEMARS